MSASCLPLAVAMQSLGNGPSNGQIAKLRAPIAKLGCAATQGADYGFVYIDHFFDPQPPFELANNSRFCSGSTLALTWAYLYFFYGGPPNFGGFVANNAMFTTGTRSIPLHFVVPGFSVIDIPLYYSDDEAAGDTSVTRLVGSGSSVTLEVTELYDP